MKASDSSTLTQRWHLITVSWRSRWQALAPQERSALTLAGWALTLLLLWLVLLHPALRTRAEVPPELAQAEAQLQTMQTQAQEAKALRALPSVPPEQALAALKTATERLGSSAQLTVQDDRATLTLSGIGPEQLQAWLAEARGAARARPVEAQVKRGPHGFTGRIVVALGEDSQ